METLPPYEELAIAIARCVHDCIRRAEPGTDGSQVMTVDTACSSGRQSPAEVLQQLGLLEPIDHLNRRYVFICPPDAFVDTIARNSGNGCSYDMLVIALVYLLEAYPDRDDVRDCLIRLGVCEPPGRSDEAGTKTQPVSESTSGEPDPPQGPIYKKVIRVAHASGLTDWCIKSSYPLPSAEPTRWTARKQHYDKLRFTWD